MWRCIAGRNEPRGAERGVTLVEIVIALGILSIVLMSLGGLAFQISVQTRRSTALSYRSAAAQIAQTRIEGLPWNYLTPPLVDSVLGCATDTTGQLIYTRCTNVTDTLGLKLIRVVLTATGNLTAPADTLVVYRARPQPQSPFNR